MAKKKRRVLIAFDLPEAHDPAETFHSYLNHQDYRDERHVYQALKKLGYSVELLGLYDDLPGFLNHLKSEKPDLVFIMCESFCNQRDKASHIVSTLEMLDIPYTGASAESLNLCRNKGLSKKILTYHNINVPQFVICRNARSIPNLNNLPYPAIVKPLELEASEGISFSSVVSSPRQAKEQIKKLYKRYKTPVIVEEYIKGRELYVGIIGNKQATVFPPQELIFRKRPKSDLNIATYKVKWDKNYRRQQGIGNQKARALSVDLQKNLQKTCVEIYQLLGIKGYARFDLRITKGGNIFFIEANPNPAINRTDDFAMTAKHGGLSYEKLIDKIVHLGLAA